MNEIDYTNLVKQSVSKSDFAKKLGYNYHNGKIANIINEIIVKYNLDILHFRSNGGGWNLKHKFEERICPVCKNLFTTQIGSKKEKFTCGHSCSNKFFSNKRVLTKDLKQYTTICFRYHKKECVICNEKNIVSVHHFDENHENNKPENLIPLCPTHHQYCHSRYKEIIYNNIVEYRNKFIEKMKLTIL